MNCFSSLFLDLPLNVIVKQIEPVGVIKAGTRVVMACTAANSNPESQINWFKNSQIMSFDLNSDAQKNTSNKLSNDYETISYMTVKTEREREREKLEN